VPIAFRTVTSSKNVIRFSDRVNDKAVRDFVPTLYDVLNRGNRQMVLDFRRCERAYADAVLPIICLLDHRRERGDTFEAWLPELPTLRQLFLNANWAHYMDSAHPKLDMETRQHLAARRYGTHAEQQDAVNSVIDVVLRNMDLDRDAIAALEWSTNEITDNVLNHARSTHGGLVQVSTFRDEHKIKVVVADAGRGIPSAMRDAFPDLRDDAGAISEAVKSGVTSIPDSGQGNGLAGSLRIATYAEGSFKITSGRASLNVFRERPDSRYRTKKSRAPRGFHFPGTAVMIELSTDAAFDIGEALALNGAAHAPSDIVEVRYTSAGGDLILPLQGEGLGFGTRHAGVELRRKCRNLLNAEPEKRLVLDWAGVPLVSSSFADEGMGKLFVELGPTTFASRVAHINTEPLVRSLLDRAIMQRVAQVVRSESPPA
jgi:anti-sigma regulatory factor (Ser/Thr protein kinase)